MASNKTSVYKVGDRVRVRDNIEHSADTKGKKGTIVEISTPALGVKFDGMTMVHKWYADEEVQRTWELPKK